MNDEYFLHCIQFFLMLLSCKQQALVFRKLLTRPPNLLILNKQIRWVSQLWNEWNSAVSSFKASSVKPSLSFPYFWVEACRVKAVTDIACPFLEEPVDVKSQIFWRNLCQERVIRSLSDVLSFPEEYPGLLSEMKIRDRMGIGWEGYKH